MFFRKELPFALLLAEVSLIFIFIPTMAFTVLGWMGCDFSDYRILILFFGYIGIIVYSPIMKARSKW